MTRHGHLVQRGRLAGKFQLGSPVFQISQPGDRPLRVCTTRKTTMSRTRNRTQNTFTGSHVTVRFSEPARATTQRPGPRWKGRRRNCCRTATIRSALESAKALKSSENRISRRGHWAVLQRYPPKYILICCPVRVVYTKVADRGGSTETQRAATFVLPWHRHRAYRRLGRPGILAGKLPTSGRKFPLPVGRLLRSHCR